jgi:hypothetical protein
MDIETWLGDITELEVDAIVNAAKNLSESLSALHACLNDTREFIKNNKGD